MNCVQLYNIRRRSYMYYKASCIKENYLQEISTRMVDLSSFIPIYHLFSVLFLFLLFFAIYVSIYVFIYSLFVSLFLIYILWVTWSKKWPSHASSPPLYAILRKYIPCFLRRVGCLSSGRTKALLCWFGLFKVFLWSYHGQVIIRPPRHLKRYFKHILRSF